MAVSDWQFFFFYFMNWYYLQMNILDGKTGLPMLSHPYIDSVGSQMGGLSISMEGSGNDWFLYWTANCVGHEGSQSSYSFAKGKPLQLVIRFLGLQPSAS